MKRFIAIASAFAASLAFADTESDSAKEEALIDETIAKARAYLGKEKDLEAVQSVRYKGALIYGNGDSGVVDIVYMKPLFHQFETMLNDFHEVSTLKNTEAWRLAEHVSQPGARSLEFYDVADVRQLQAGVQEALSFFKRPTARGSGVEYVGEDEIEGVKTRVIVYFYNDGRVWFRRFFDIETGRLVFTINEKGVAFEESGEKIVSGVRFPAKLVTTFLTTEGEQAMELSYTTIEVNGEIDKKRFNMPLVD